MSDTTTSWDKMLAFLGTDREAALRNAMYHVAKARGIRYDILAPDAAERVTFEAAVRVAHSCGATTQELASTAHVSPLVIRRIVR